MEFPITSNNTCKHSDDALRHENMERFLSYNTNTELLDVVFRALTLYFKGHGFENIIFFFLVLVEGTRPLALHTDVM
jgi:hypothetical protein